MSTGSPAWWYASQSQRRRRQRLVDTDCCVSLRVSLTCSFGIMIVFGTDGRRVRSRSRRSRVVDGRPVGTHHVPGSTVVVEPLAREGSGLDVACEVVEG